MKCLSTRKGQPTFKVNRKVIFLQSVLAFYRQIGYT